MGGGTLATKEITTQKPPFHLDQAKVLTKPEKGILILSGINLLGAEKASATKH